MKYSNHTTHGIIYRLPCMKTGSNTVWFDFDWLLIFLWGFFFYYSAWGSPVEFGSLHQSVCVSITDERPAVQTGEAFWVIFLFPCNLPEKKKTTELNQHSAFCSLKTKCKQHCILIYRENTWGYCEFTAVFWCDRSNKQHEALLSGLRSRARSGHWG